MSPPNVFVAIPNLGKIRTDLVAWILSCHSHFLHPETPIKGMIHLNVDRPIEVNRNIITNKFLETDCTHLLMIDSDVRPAVNIIPDWIKKDKDIIGAYVPIWNKELKHPRFFAYHKKNNKYVNIDPTLGFQQCDVVGTGAIMIKRNVIEALPNPRFRQILTKTGGFGMGEDQYFVECAKNNGYEVWIDPTPMDQRTEINLTETMNEEIIS